MTANAVNGQKDENFFAPISADENSEGVSEIESLCVNCEQNGMTKLLLVEIPFYKQVIISSFNCEHCSYSNSEVQSAGAIQLKGVKLTLSVEGIKDLNRQVIRSDSAKVSIPDLDFEIPPSSQKGTFSTVEGILQRAVEGLMFEQPVRKALNPDIAEKIEIFVEKLKNILTEHKPFTLIIEDPSGNSFIENPLAPSSDRNLRTEEFKRSKEQNEALGLQEQGEETDTNAIPAPHEGLDLRNEVVTFHTNCYNCSAPNDTNMKTVSIPHFKEVILFATSCDRCGYKSNEVKSGAGYEPKGKTITLRVEEAVDLSRDVLKSETCSVLLPELDLETGGMAISGKFTTVEGLLVDLKHLMVTTNPFIGGDSQKVDKLKVVGETLDSFAKGNTAFTLILDDPNNNSYVQDIFSPEVDPRLSEVLYERSFEQNEELGLNDMNTENYQS